VSQPRVSDLVRGKIDRFSVDTLGVSRNDGIRWHKQWVNVSQTLGEEHVGLVEIDDGEWDVYFGPLRLGRFHERTLLIEDALGRHSRRPY
jgi:putative transposase